MAITAANNTEDMGYDKPYEPIEHTYQGYTIAETLVRDTQWDVVDTSGRLPYRPSQRQYTVSRPDGTTLYHGNQPVVLTRYGAALQLVGKHMAERQQQEALIRELVTGQSN